MNEQNPDGPVSSATSPNPPPAAEKKPWIRVGGMELAPYGYFPDAMSFTETVQLMTSYFDVSRMLSAQDRKALTAVEPLAEVFVNRENRLVSMMGSYDQIYLADVKRESYAVIVPLPGVEPVRDEPNAAAYLNPASGEVAASTPIL